MIIKTYLITRSYTILIWILLLIYTFHNNILKFYEDIKIFILNFIIVDCVLIIFVLIMGIFALKSNKILK
jgi:hypothetical protein